MIIRYRSFIIGLILPGLFLLAAYLPTLQTIPNGADHYFMADVGETQIVLNTWGTLHATGYPLYVMSGNALVILLRAVGIDAATAPALVSLFWTLIALALIGLLAYRLSGWRDALLVTVLFGLTRTVWIHAAVAEIYSFGLVILALLLLLALWPEPVPARLYLLALVGGIGVFHHRALLMVAPALLVTVWPDLKRQMNPGGLGRLLALLLIGLLGFLPYVYLPLRAVAGGAWVYGEPGTWQGFWDQFLGREAARFIGLPPTFDALLDNIQLVNNVLITDLTLPGLIAGAAGLLLALRMKQMRRAGIALLLNGAVAWLFHIMFYTDILSALILPVTLSLAFGWLFLIAWLRTRHFPVIAYYGVTVLFAGVMIAQNFSFIRRLTTDSTGLQTIALVQNAPLESALMLDWGVRHFAAGFGKDILGLLPTVTLLDHNADFRATAAQQMLITPDYTFYHRPLEWWEAQLGTPVYLRAAAPELVEIAVEPHMTEGELQPEPSAVHVQIVCRPAVFDLYVTWGAGETPAHDLSVFVHLLDSQGNVLAQNDQFAPVYGLRPLTGWLPGELIADVYTLPYSPDAAAVRYGLYSQQADGSFRNALDSQIDVQCDS